MADWQCDGALCVGPRLTVLLTTLGKKESVTVRRCSLYVARFLAAVYGGHFGASLGIVLLAVMVLTLDHDLNVVHGIRRALAFMINLVAAVSSSSSADTSPYRWCGPISQEC